MNDIHGLKLLVFSISLIFGNCVYADVSEDLIQLKPQFTKCAATLALDETFTDRKAYGWGTFFVGTQGQSVASRQSRKIVKKCATELIKPALPKNLQLGKIFASFKDGVVEYRIAIKNKASRSVDVDLTKILVGSFRIDGSDIQ